MRTHNSVNQLDLYLSVVGGGDRQMILFIYLADYHIFIMAHS